MPWRPRVKRESEASTVQPGQWLHHQVPVRGGDPRGGPPLLVVDPADLVVDPADALDALQCDLGLRCGAAVGADRLGLVPESVDRRFGLRSVHVVVGREPVVTRQQERGPVVVAGAPGRVDDSPDPLVDADEGVEGLLAVRARGLTLEARDGAVTPARAATTGSHVQGVGVPEGDPRFARMKHCTEATLRPERTSASAGVSTAIARDWPRATPDPGSK